MSILYIPIQRQKRPILPNWRTNLQVPSQQTAPMASISTFPMTSTTVRKNNDIVLPSTIPMTATTVRMNNKIVLPPPVRTSLLPDYSKPARGPCIVPFLPPLRAIKDITPILPWIYLNVNQPKISSNAAVIFNSDEKNPEVENPANPEKTTDDDLMLQEDLGEDSIATETSVSDIHLPIPILMEKNEGVTISDGFFSRKERKREIEREATRCSRPINIRWRNKKLRNVPTRRITRSIAREAINAPPDPPQEKKKKWVRRCKRAKLY